MTDNCLLRVSFVFPGHPNVIEIHLNREVGVGNNPFNKYAYECIPAIELALSSVPALDMSSVFTKAEKNSLTTEFGLGFDRDTLCLDIAIALADAFGTDDVVIGDVIDNRKVCC